VKTLIRYFSDIELQLIVRQLLSMRHDPAWSERAAFVWLMFSGGFRISEAAALRIEDCHDNYVHVRDGKTGARDVELMPEGLWLYREYVRSLPPRRVFLFQSPQKLQRIRGGKVSRIARAISVRQADYWWNGVISQCGVRPLTSHAARRTFATWEAERLSRIDLMDQLGHTEWKTTDQYYRGSIPGRRYYKVPPKWRTIMANEHEERGLRVVEG
jgi:integrase